MAATENRAHDLIRGFVRGRRIYREAVRLPVTRSGGEITPRDEWPAVLGYPEGMIGPGRSPIWKRGSMASEPKYNWRDKPGFLIDTATRNGMSGAPVVARHRVS